MITHLLKLDAIAFLVICFSFLSLPTIAEAESENSSDSYSKPIRNEVPESEAGSKTQIVTPSDISIESRESEPAQIGDMIEVNPRSQQWDTLHSGDLNRGTVKFRFPL